MFILKGVKVEIPNRLDGTIIAQKLQSGEYEGHESDAVLSRVEPGTKVLELGAGLGYVSTLCAKIAGAENVTSLEANPLMLDPIRANLRLNGQDGVNLWHGAVVGDGHTDQTASFYAGKLFWGGGLVENGETREGTIDVPTVRISDLLDIQRPNFVIMDIEGAEQHLFKRKWPKCVRFVVLELHLSKYPKRVVKEIVDCMSASGLTYDPATSNGRTLGFIRVGKVYK